MAITSLTKTLPITPITASWVHQHKVSVDMLRADLVDPELSGNKFFKLHFNLQQAQQQGYATLLSFGGAWSNHLHALAAAGQRLGLRTVGIVRGEASDVLTPCLQDAQRFGMQLHFVSRELYRRKDEPALLAQWQQQFGPCWVIPEGGANHPGILGCQHLVQQPHDYTHIVLACGTGATLAGVVSVSKVPVLGIQVLKGDGYLQREVSRLLLMHGFTAQCAWQVLDQWHCGGYAKVPPALLAFIQRFEAATAIPLEPIYSGKVLWALVNLIAVDFFAEGSRLLVIHGGGLQGRRAFEG